MIVILGGLPALAADPTFTMTGVALGQALRLNVQAPASSYCNAQLSFVDRNGTPVPNPYKTKDRPPVPNPFKTVNLNPEQSDSLDISAVSLGVQFGHRAELRPVVTITSSVDQA
jgi:hypothetical protein